MPTWAIGVIEWVVGMALRRVNPEDVKAALATLFTSLDALVMSQEARIKGPLEGVADEVAQAFHECMTVVVAALK